MNMKAVGKRSLEWDSHDWNWDGDLFTATQVNSLPSDCNRRQFPPVISEISNPIFTNNSSPCSHEMSAEEERTKRDLEKQRREKNVEARSLNFKLGGQYINPVNESELENLERKNGKKAKVGSSSNCVVCQVDDCRDDLSNASAYNRRHKVCNMHSKANMAMVRNLMQRFCQQCSRFHVLQEFDEEKRSCREGLEKHKLHRRKKPDVSAQVNGGPGTNENGSNDLFRNVLNILSGNQSNGSNITKDQDLLFHLLRSLSSNIAGTIGATLSGVGQGSQAMFNVHEPSTANMGQCLKRTTNDDARTRTTQTPSSSMNVHESVTGIDLNNVSNESQDLLLGNLERCHFPSNPNSGSSNFPSWLHKTSKSASTSVQPNWESKFLTDQIVIKLLEKDPNNLPSVLRTQFYNWLKDLPTDMESYIRPGCILLTIYLRMGNSSWEEICDSLGSNLSRLLEASDDPFWKTGWIFARVQHHIAFINNGQVIIDTLLPTNSRKIGTIFSVSPVAVPKSERVQFLVKGYNFSESARLLCALEGKYILQEACLNLMDDAETLDEDDDLQSLSFSCSIPNVIGRGFIEVEDHSFDSNFLPFIVAEQDVCSEICTLETVLDLTDTEKSEKVEAKNQAKEFIHEMGWLLHRTQLKSRLGDMDPNSTLFSFNRIKWLIEFAMDHDWCAVINKLLDIFFSGVIEAQDSSNESALMEMFLLHKAVQRNCRPMVEYLLRYTLRSETSEDKKVVTLGPSRFLFRPDVVGPAGLTPLHIVASTAGSDSLVDALTDDPGSVGLEAWKSAKDNNGLTPNDYASLQGHDSYIQLIQIKVTQKLDRGHTVIDIPNSLQNPKTMPNGKKSAKVSSFQSEKGEAKTLPIQRNCKLCDKKVGYGYRGTSLAYRPAMLSILSIAALCVCVALLFKSMPEVRCTPRPFSWDKLKYGSS